MAPSLGILFRMVLRGTFSAAPAPAVQTGASRVSVVRDPGHQSSLCVVGLVAGALVLAVGDAARSIAIGVGLLLVAGARGVVVVARSPAAAD